MPRVEDIHEEYNLDFLAWNVAGGVPSEIEWVMKNLCYEQCLKILMMKKYDSWVQERIMRSKVKNG